MKQIKNFKIPCVGYELNGDLYEAESDVVLLNLIGYQSDIERYTSFLTAIQEKTGVNVVTFDYSGHGQSPFELKEMRPAQQFLEVITVFDWIIEQFPSKEIYVMGASYGGFLATQLTKYRRFSKLMLRVPAIYKPDNFYTKWADYNVEEGRKYRYDSTNLDQHPLLKRASSFEGRTMVITHEFDESCPKNTTDAFIRAFNAEHWEAKGLYHGFSKSNMTEEQSQEYYNVVSDWIMA